MIVQNYFKERIYFNEKWYSFQKDHSISYPKGGNNNNSIIEDESYWYQHRLNCIKFLLTSFCEEKVFFDIGGGNGLICQEMQKHNFDCVLIEPSKDGVINAYNRQVDQIIQSSWLNLKPVENSFENIGAFDVIEHVKDDFEFVKSIQYALKKNGIFISTVPALNLLWTKADTKAGHFRRYNLTEYINLLSEAGFTILYSTYLFMFLVPAIFIGKKMIGQNLPEDFKNTNSRRLQSIQHMAKRSNESLQIKLIDRFINFELQRIKRHKTIPLGSSCLVIAEKK